MERGNIDFGKLLNGVTTENVYVLTNDNRKVIEALRFLPGNREIKPKKVEDLVKAMMDELSLISEILGTRSVDHSTGWMKARTRLGIPFTKFIVRLKRRAATWHSFY